MISLKALPERLGDEARMSLYWSSLARKDALEELTRAWWGVAWTIALTLAGTAVVLTLLPKQPSAVPVARIVEPPPLQFVSGPTLTGRTYELDLKDLDEVNALCARLLGPAWPKAAYWMGCYDWAHDVVIVPTKGAWPSERERQALITHEWAHARGWRHEADGKYGRQPADVEARSSVRVAAGAEPAR